MGGSGIHQPKLDMFFSSPIVETEGPKSTVFGFLVGLCARRKKRKKLRRLGAFFTDSRFEASTVQVCKQIRYNENREFLLIRNLVKMLQSQKT